MGGAGLGPVAHLEGGGLVFGAFVALFDWQHSEECSLYRNGCRFVGGLPLLGPVRYWMRAHAISVSLGPCNFSSCGIMNPGGCQFRRCGAMGIWEVGWGEDWPIVGPAFTGRALF